jgi:PadR family transcriptional regulator PadR
MVYLSMSGSESDARSELLPGTLEMLVLQTLTIAPMHGYGIARHIEQQSADVLQVEQGSLYPALERLQRSGWVTGKWGKSPTGRRARYYTITASGRKQLGLEIAGLERVYRAITRVLRHA